MYTKQVLFIVSLIILVAMFNTAWACHEAHSCKVQLQLSIVRVLKYHLCHPL